MAHAGNPHYFVIGQHHRPTAPPFGVYTGVAEEPLHSPRLGGAERDHPVSGAPRSHDYVATGGEHSLPPAVRRTRDSRLSLHRPEAPPPEAHLTLQRERAVWLARRPCSSQHDRATVQHGFPAPRELDARSRSTTNCKLGDALGSTSVEHRAHVCGERGPEEPQCCRIIARQVCPGNLEHALHDTYANSTGDLHIQLIAKSCGASRELQKLAREPGRAPLERRKKIQPYTIAQVTAREVGRILDPLHAQRVRVRGDVAAEDSEQWTEHRTTRVESREPARTRAAQRTHEDSLHLIVQRVRRGHRRALGARYLAEESPARLAPRCFTPRARPAPHPAASHGKAQLSGAPLHQLRRLRGRRAATMVEGRHARDPIAIVTGEDIEEHHRVAPARDREHVAALRRKSRRTRIAHAPRGIPVGHLESYARQAVRPRADAAAGWHRPCTRLRLSLEPTD